MRIFIFCTFISIQVFAGGSKNAKSPPPRSSSITKPIGISTEQISDTNFAWDINAAIASQFISRGAIYSQGPTFNPSAGINWNGLYLNTWLNINLQPEKDRDTFSEIDFIWGYVYEGSNFGFNPSMKIYVLPNLAEDLTLLADLEVWGKVGPGGFYLFNSLGGLPQLGAYYMEFGPYLEYKINSSLRLAASSGVVFANEIHNSYLYDAPVNAITGFQSDASLQYYR